MFSLTMAAAHMPTADELSAAVAALMKEEKSGELDVKQIHERLLQERNWKVPERRLNKFVKRHRGPPSEANASPVRETTRGVFKKLFQRKSPEPAARGGGAGGGAGGKPAAAAAATVVTDQSPGRISAAASLESSVLPDPRDKELDGVPSTIVTTTTATAPAPGTSSGAAAGDGNQAVGEALSDAAADAGAANKSAGGDENEGDDGGESKPCFLLPCEGMSCTVL